MRIACLILLYCISPFPSAFAQRQDESPLPFPSGEGSLKLSLVAVANAPDTMNCKRDSVMLTAAGSSFGPSIQYFWTSLTGGAILSGANTATPWVKTGGIYRLNVSDMLTGEIASDQVEVAVDTIKAKLLILPPGKLSCQLKTVTITAANLQLGNFDYSWTAANGGFLISGQNTLTPVANAAGTFTLSAVNKDNGCIATADVPVAAAPDMPLAKANAPGPLTCARPEMEIDVKGSSSGPTINYAWTYTSGGSILFGTPGGGIFINKPATYILTVTDMGSNCTAAYAITITEDKTPPPAEIDLPDTLTCAALSVPLLANPTHAALDYSYAWSCSGGCSASGLNTANPFLATAPGNYYVTVTGIANGCTAVDTTVVLQNIVPPVAVIDPPDTLTCEVTEITLNGSGLAPISTYEWQTSGGQIAGASDQAQVKVSAVGIYTLKITDLINGCSATAGVSVTENKTPPFIQIQTPEVLTCLLTSINLESSSNSANLAYSWAASNGGKIINGIDGPKPLVGATGTYTLVVKDDSNGCTASASVTVADNIVSPVVDAGLDQDFGCKTTSLSLDGAAAGQGPLSAQWTALNGGNIVSPANSFSITVDKPGQYVLSVLDNGNGCYGTDTMSVGLDQNAPQIVFSTPDTLTCLVLEINLSAQINPGYSWQAAWSTSGGGNVTGSLNTLTTEVNAPGVYLLTVENIDNGCTAVAQVGVAENLSAPVVNIGDSLLLTCLHDTAAIIGVVAGEPDFTFYWQTFGGHFAAGESTLFPLIDADGDYVLTATNPSTGCSSSDYIEVFNDKLPPIISIASPFELTCIRKSVVLEGAIDDFLESYSVTWNTLDGNILYGADGLNPEVDLAGAYNMIVKNLDNGCEAKASVLVQLNIEPPIAEAGPSIVLTCKTPSLPLDGTASSSGNPFVYQWTCSAEGKIESGGATLMPEVSAPGTYYLSITNSTNGCTAADSTSVDKDNLAPVVAALSPLPISCIRDSVQLDASASSSGPDFSIEWATADGNILSGNSSLQPTVDKPGSYLLTVTNLQNGCKDSVKVTVVENYTLPGATASTNGQLHCNQPEVALSGSSMSTAPDLQFAWSTPQGLILSGADSPNALAAKPGIYYLTVTVALTGCSSTAQITVTEIPPLSFEPTIWQPTCLDPKGIIDVGFVEGGAGGNLYSIDEGKTFGINPIFDDLSPGIYTLTVKDKNGCTTELEVEVEKPLAPELELPETLALALGDSMLIEPKLNVPYDHIAVWNWSDTTGLSCKNCPTPWAKPIRSGGYTLFITDKNGCTTFDRLTILIDGRKRVYAPNIISPDGDHLNDSFTLFGKGIGEIEFLQIFDRWGNQMFSRTHFQPNDESLGWSGTHKNALQTPGVYIWLASVKFVNGETIIYEGDITVVN